MFKFGIDSPDQNKDFYKLCSYMEPQYYQYEFDLRLYLTHMDASGKLAWSGNQQVAPR